MQRRWRGRAAFGGGGGCAAIASRRGGLRGAQAHRELRFSPRLKEITVSVSRTCRGNVGWSSSEAVEPSRKFLGPVRAETRRASRDEGAASGRSWPHAHSPGPLPPPPRSAARSAGGTGSGPGGGQGSLRLAATSPRAPAGHLGSRTALTDRPGSDSPMVCHLNPWSWTPGADGGAPKE